MLEIKLVRENLELVKTAMQNRGTAFDWEAFQARDARRKTHSFRIGRTPPPAQQRV
jgi:seryl-tRNA synthetase